jgi:GNAT superfamily N-acetyltransferase
MTLQSPQVRYEIRPARADDFVRVAALSGQLGYPSTPEEVARRIAGMLHSAEHGVYVAQSAAGDITGAIGVFVYRSFEVDPRAEVSGLVVDERYRSQGIGLRLLERAEEWAREKGCKTIGLRSNVIRGRAHAFYERHGYEHFKSQKSFRKAL